MKEEEEKNAGPISCNSEKDEIQSDSKAKLCENNDELFKFKDPSQIKTIDHLF